MCAHVLYSAHMGRTVAPTPFAGWLDEQLRSRGWGVRTLARRINQREPEIARRALNRYLFEGAKPTPGYRSSIAAAFEVGDDEMPVGDDDDEESDSLRRRRPLTIDELLRARIDELVSEAHDRLGMRG